MKRTGMKTATSEIVIERIVKPISFEPRRDATAALSPFSIRRTMFSSWTIASSTTNPTESVRPMRERLSRLNPRTAITANVPKRDVGSAIDGMNVERRFLRNRKITRTTRTIVRRSVSWTSRTLSRMPTRAVEHDVHVHRGRDLHPERGKERLDRVDDLDRVRVRLALDREDDRPVALEPRGLPVVLDAVEDVRDLAEAHGRAVPPRDDERPVRRRVQEPAVRLDRERFVGPVDDADRLVRVARGDRGGDLVDPDLPAREDAGVDLDAHGVLLRAVDVHLRDAAHGRDALREDRLGPLVHLGHRERRRGQDDEEDRLHRGVDLAQARRVRHRRRELARGSPRSPSGRPAPPRRCRGRGRTGA